MLRIARTEKLSKLIIQAHQKYKEIIQQNASMCKGYVDTILGANKKAFLCFGLISTLLIDLMRFIRNCATLPVTHTIVAAEGYLEYCRV
jgi:hypothetical protein